MGDLQFCCPVTSQLVDCGFETNRQTLATISALPLRIHCPHCHLVHQFSFADALAVPGVPIPEKNGAKARPVQRMDRATLRRKLREVIAHEEARHLKQE